MTLQIVLPRVQTSEWGECKGKPGDVSQSGLSAKHPCTSNRVFPKWHIVGGTRKTRSELIIPGRTTFLQLKGQEQVALCPQTIVLFLATCSRQQLGFKPSCSFPPCPIPGCAVGSRTSGSSRSGERSQGPTAPKGAQDKSGPLCPGSSPDGAASHEDHPSRQACGASGRGCCQPGRNAAVGAALGRKGITRGFQERKGSKGRGGMWTPGPWWRAGSHLQAPESSVPFLPEPFPSPGPVALLSPSRLLCAGVRHSDPPSPRGGNSSCRSATGSIGTFGKEKVTFPALGRAWPPSPHSALCGRCHHRLLLGGRSSPR